METQTRSMSEKGGEDRHLSFDEIKELLDNGTPTQDEADAAAKVQSHVDAARKEILEGARAISEAIPDTKIADALGDMFGLVVSSVVNELMQSMVEIVKEVAGVRGATVLPIEIDESDTRWQQLSEEQAEEILKVAVEHGAVPINSDNFDRRQIAFSLILHADKLSAEHPEAAGPAALIELADKWGIAR